MGSAPGTVQWRPWVLATVIGAAGLSVAYVIAASHLQTEHRARLAAELEAEARRIATDGSLPRAETDLPAMSADQCPQAPPYRVRLVLPDGTLACGAAEDAGDPHLRQALEAALSGRTVRSDAAKANGAAALSSYLASSVPVRGRDRVVAALQLLYQEPPAPRGLVPLRAAFLAAGGVLGLGWLAILWLVGRDLARDARTLFEPLRRLREGRSASRHVPLAGSPLAPLAESLHEAAEGIQARLAQLAQRLGEREAVLASMMEGVVAISPSGVVLELNPAAGRMFDLDPEAARGRDLLEVVRNPELQRFVRDAQSRAEALERELTLYGPEPRILQVHGNPLRDAHGRGLGTLLVLNDVTHLRRLERMRQDFVANVSHEIKTPITSIKGFVETLRDGAIEDPDNALRFLEIIGRHAERLNSITDDLLNLSRIEQQSIEGAVRTESVAVADVLRSATGLCAEKAAQREIRLHVACDPTLRAELNPQLVEQAIVNLVDNAVKYAPGRTEVSVEATAASPPHDPGVTIRVVDQGPGIQAEHLPRLFERFYRVDKARSRKAGGTGLGLAIVKHIAQAHGGRVEVSSQLGEGTTFTLHIPEHPPERPET